VHAFRHRAADVYCRKVVRDDFYSVCKFIPCGMIGCDGWYRTGRFIYGSRRITDISISRRYKGPPWRLESDEPTFRHKLQLILNKNKAVLCRDPFVRSNIHPRIARVPGIMLCRTGMYAGMFTRFLCQAESNRLDVATSRPPGWGGYNCGLRAAPVRNYSNLAPQCRRTAQNLSKPRSADW
jgi:hypothetical protein